VIRAQALQLLENGLASSGVDQSGTHDRISNSHFEIAMHKLCQVEWIVMYHCCILSIARMLTDQDILDHSGFDTSFSPGMVIWQRRR